MVKKGEVLRKENHFAIHLEEKDKHPSFGFVCLHYSVSEGAGYIEIIILNKTRAEGSIGVKTVDGDAIAGDDYESVDEILKFNKGDSEGKIRVTINDDDNWEPDEDFYVVLYDPEDSSKEQLQGEDTKCTVTIIDDDKPGTLSFQNRSVKVVADEKKVEIKVLRQNGCDGDIQVEYETFSDGNEHGAKPEIDFKPTKGVLKLAHNTGEAFITVEIIQKDEKEERQEQFGVRLFNPSPAGVKLSKKDTCYVEIVTDVEG